MNNHINMYRMEHATACFPGLKEPVGLGPYTFTTHFRRNFLVLRDSPFEKMCDCLRKFEPRPLRYGREDVYPNKTLHASFNWVRPGPREDPHLRDWFKTAYLNGKANGTLTGEGMKHEPILFGFNNEWQLHRWFFDKTEFELLEQNGFKVVKRRVKTTDVVQGFAQCLWKIKNIIA